MPTMNYAWCCGDAYRYAFDRLRLGVGNVFATSQQLISTQEPRENCMGTCVATMNGMLYQFALKLEDFSTEVGHTSLSPIQQR
jgi:hypothetical protein